MKLAFGSLVCLLISAIAGMAQATVVPAIDVPALVEDSDLIVVGRAVQVNAQRSGTPSETFSIAVDRTIKGAP